MKNLNRHIKAGAIAGLVFPVILFVIFLFAGELLDVGLAIMVSLIIGLLAGAGLGALVWQIEKWTSKRLWLLLSILPGLVVGVFFFTILFGSD